VNPTEDETRAPESLPEVPAEEALADASPAPEISAETGERVDYRDRWLRTEADLQNYRRRAQRDLDEARRDAEERVMLELIGALDDLERALAAGREAGAPESWIAGVELVANRMSESLARFGVATLDPRGEPFDPEQHEALLEVDPPEGVAGGCVVQVVLRGYRRGARVLRAARVVVARRGA
jgi:molecular chaperone GrpE